MRHLLNFRPLALSGLLLLATGIQAQSQERRSECVGSSGGFIDVGRADLVYSATFAGDSGRLEAAVLVRGPEAWRNRSAPVRLAPAARRPDGTERRLSGATVGPLTVLVEVDTRTLWLDVDSLALGQANVALVEVDPTGHARLTGTARVTPELPLGASGCRGGAAEIITREAVLHSIKRDSLVRVFLAR